LPRLIPPRIAMQIMLTGDPIDADRAYQVGLVNEVVPAADLTATAQRIAANAPLSVLAAKRTVRLVAENALADAYAEAERIWQPYLSEDAQEGPVAFRDRRTPRWKGR
jgi:enoyl-CoA hydratase/carnithine racemase